MGWLHDTGYGPAYEHEGFPASVLANGALTKDPAGFGAGEIVGWKSACECGWRSSLTYWREDFPSRTDDPPDSVDGSSSRSGAWSEWREHIYAAVPELILADVVNVALRPTTEVLDHPVVAAVVAIMRERGVPWTDIAEATGVTTRDAKWAWSQPRLRSSVVAVAAQDVRPPAAVPRPDPVPGQAGRRPTDMTALGR